MEEKKAVLRFSTNGYLEISYPASGFSVKTDLNLSDLCDFVIKSINRYGDRKFKALELIIKLSEEVNSTI